MARIYDKMPFMEHLGELRTRIMRSLVALLIGLLISFPFSQKIVDFLSDSWIAPTVKSPASAV